MHGTTMGRSRLIAAFAAPVLTLGVTGCDGNDAGEANSAVGVADSSGSDGSQAPQPDTESPDTPEETDTPGQAPAHGDALAAGRTGEYAIVCGYTFDADEIKQMQLIATSQVTPEATIYLDGSTVYWDIPEADDRVSHILGLDGDTYAWKVPGDGTGVHGIGTATDTEAQLMDRMDRNAHDCTVYDGPDSIFEVPDDIAFQAVG